MTNEVTETSAETTDKTAVPATAPVVAAPATTPVVTTPATAPVVTTPATAPAPATAPVVEIEEIVKTPCPHCGTLFVAGTEPWSKQKLHCSRHDMVYAPGSVCSGCEGEFGHDAAVERAAADVKALAYALSAVRRPT
jgi:hypothetical protein